MTAPRIPRTSIRHHRTEDNVEQDIVARVFRYSGTVIGIGFGIYGAIRLTHSDLTYPYVSTALANHLPIGFYQGAVVAFFVAGSFINYYSHFGITIDIAIDRIKNFPILGSYEDMKKWVLDGDITHATDIVGDLFGLALSGTFIYYNATSKDPFALSYGAAKSVPPVIMQIGAPIYMAGALSNTITYFTEGVKLTVTGAMDGISWLSPKVQDCLSLPVFNNTNPHNKMDNAANLLIIPGVLIGIGYGIYAAVELQTKDLGSFPYLSADLAAHLPLGFYQALTPILHGGLAANCYNNLGACIDIVIDGVKIFPLKGSKDDIKNWFKKCDIKKLSHVMGGLFGLALSGAFIYYCAVSDDPFALPFGAEKNVPKALLAMGAPFYMTGASANLFSYFTEGAHCVVTKSVSGLSYVGTKIKGLSSFSIFKKTTTGTAPSHPAPDVRHAV